MPPADASLITSLPVTPPAGATRLLLRGVVCPRCARQVRQELEHQGLQVLQVGLGGADVTTPASGKPDPAALQAALGPLGFDLLEDPRDQVVEQLKAAVVEWVHYTPVEQWPVLNYSVYLSQRLGRDYHTLSQVFSAREGLTLEKYIIRQKVERAKELLSYQDDPVAEVARQLGYRSAAHLTNQFKQVTGMTPTEFQRLDPGHHRRSGLHEVSRAKPGKRNEP
ncbi:helix-turn-helix domain-containing protein [Hymenobacter sp. BT175]|uniref:helix-turn-helix domain-containing protein n=1 Tax=Hymenobacter translucens TaxID=2886507 RepID=UPI001D0F3666|nr:helix-turn-helix domain-containing protein [Hymenobacter translucens]MCC2544883.1 helix-turn-helix domain-containing protein [Hymenobacter translucens]